MGVPRRGVFLNPWHAQVPTWSSAALAAAEQQLAAADRLTAVAPLGVVVLDRAERLLDQLPAPAGQHELAATRGHDELALLQRVERLLEDVLGVLTADALLVVVGHAVQQIPVNAMSRHDGGPVDHPDDDAHGGAHGVAAVVELVVGQRALLLVETNTPAVAGDFCIIS